MAMGPTEISSSSTEGFLTHCKNFAKKIPAQSERLAIVVVMSLSNRRFVKRRNDSGESVESRLCWGLSDTG
jgi:hypothetical protein